MKKLFFISLLSLVCFSAAFASPCDNNAVKTPIIESAQAIAVSASAPEFNITLMSNPTTGYAWSVKRLDSRFITLVGNQFLPPDSNCLGASGHEVWTFKANTTAFNQPTSTVIEMAYARSWEKQGGTITKFTVTMQP